MSKLFFSCVLLLLVDIGTSVQLPSSFKKCKRTDSDFKQCLVLAAEDALSQLDKPFPEVGLVPVDPVTIPYFSVSPGNGIARFEQRYKNMKLSGMSQAHVTNFDVDFDNKKIKIDLIIPEFKIDAQYEFIGTLLGFRFQGKGPVKAVIDNFKFNFTLNLEEYEKKGVTYYKIVRSTLLLDPEMAHFKLKNLVSWDERLENDIHKVFEENWRAIFDEVKGGYELAWGQVYTSIFSKFLQKVPASEIF